MSQIYQNMRPSMENQPLDRLWAAQTQMHRSKTNGACCTRFAQFQLLARSHFQSI